jgi:uncharacterized protein YaaW (UPF0174 family)
MPNAFENRELAAEAGRKSKRGPGKKTREMKKMLADLMEKLYESVNDDLDQLDIKDKAVLLTRLAEYNVPKMRATESRVNIENLSESDINELWKRITEGE